MSYVFPHSPFTTQKQPFQHPTNQYEGLPEGFQNALRGIDAQFDAAVKEGRFSFPCCQAAHGEFALYDVSDDESVSDENLPPSLTSKLFIFSIGNIAPLPINNPVSMFYSPGPTVQTPLSGRAVFMESPVRSPDNFPLTPSRFEMTANPQMRPPLQEIQILETGCTPALGRWSLDRSPFSPEPLSQSPDSDSPVAQNVHAQPTPETPRQVYRRLVPEWTPGAPMEPMTPPQGRVYLSAKREFDKPPVRTQSFAFNSPAKVTKRAKPGNMF